MKQAYKTNHICSKIQYLGMVIFIDNIIFQEYKKVFKMLSGLTHILN
jgi:hypothetical protein